MNPGIPTRTLEGSAVSSVGGDADTGQIQEYPPELFHWGRVSLGNTFRKLTPKLARQGVSIGRAYALQRTDAPQALSRARCQGARPGYPQRPCVRALCPLLSPRRPPPPSAQRPQAQDYSLVYTAAASAQANMPFVSRPTLGLGREAQCSALGGIFRRVPWYGICGFKGKIGLR